MQLKHASAMALAGLLSSGIASAAHLDFFDAGAFDLTASPGGSDTGTQAVPGGATGALGGSRTVLLENNGTVGDVTAVLGPVFGVGGNDDGVGFVNGSDGSATITFDYGLTGDINGNFIDIPGLPGNDWLSFSLDFTGASDPLDVAVTFVTGSGTGTSTVNAIVPAGTGRFSIDYADFIAGASGSLALRDIDRATVAVTAGAGSSFSFDSTFRTGIPVPGSALLFGFGALVLGWMRKRRVKLS